LQLALSSSFAGLLPILITTYTSISHPSILG
jgi:hypothetical protein